MGCCPFWMISASEWLIVIFLIHTVFQMAKDLVTIFNRTPSPNPKRFLGLAELLLSTENVDPSVTI